MSSTEEHRLFLGLDLGGTNIKAGVVDDRGTVLSRYKRPTEAARGPQVGLANLEDAAQQAAAAAGVTLEQITSVGLASPGTMDLKAGMLLHPHNLPGWDNLPIREEVARRTNRPTVLQNDANAAAFGEYWVGAARDVDILAMYTLGTGVGGGIVIDGRILEGAHSHGSECGHVVIQMDGGRLCASGQYGTLEAYCGGRAVVERCEEALRSGRPSVLNEWLAAGRTLEPKLIAEAAEQGDELARNIVLETARYLGVGITSVMHVVDPHMVLIGGAMTWGGPTSELGQAFLRRVREEVRARAFPIPAEQTIIDYAALGGDAGFIGAAGCAKSAFEQGLL